MSSATTRLGTIAGVWRYPVKSMAGERLERASLSWRGIPGDRGWAVYDETRQGVTGAKRLPPLRACRARYVEEPANGAAPPVAEITLPDGASFTTDSPACAERLSAHAGRPVTMRALGPAGSDAAPRIRTADESEDTLRAILGLKPGEPMPDMSGLSGEHLQQLRRGNFFDAFPLHLLTRTTLRTLANGAPESVWDERRFRPNLVIEAEATEGYPEQAWIARRLRVGRAVIEVVMGCPRCVMATQAVEDVPQDHRVMRTLVRETHHIAGVYAHLIHEGDVRVGDAVELV